MARPHSIPPFPAGIDRDTFGHWLSGFTDGEGSFGLYVTHKKRSARPTPQALFVIKLRADDYGILRQIQSFLGCGTVRHETPSWASHSDQAKPLLAFGVRALDALAQKIVPHFDRYPLRAKKLRDFAIWKQGVQFLHERQRPTTSNFRWAPRFTDTELATFASLAAALKHQRRFESPELTIPARIRPETPLFDGLD